MSSLPKISRIGEDFARWDELLNLIRKTFAYMDGAIDPPSSATRLTGESLAKKAHSASGFIAEEDGRIVGSVFAAEHLTHFYVGKLAVAGDWQGQGLGKLLMEIVEGLARDAGKPVLELQVRVELEGNQAAFAHMGFSEVARTSHAGFDRPTSITMRKALA